MCSIACGRLSRLLFACFVICAAAKAAPPELQIHGQVVLPDRQPAAKALLSFGWNASSRVETEADAEGRFTLSSEFLENTVILARSADGTMQRQFLIADMEARRLTTKSQRVELRPARRLTVRMLNDSRPVSGAQVAVAYLPLAPTMTDEQGEATLHVPEGDAQLHISAWHPRLGVATGNYQPVLGNLADATVALTLYSPKLQRLRVVDRTGKPAAGVRLRASFKPVGGDWFIGSSFPELLMETNDAGEIEFAWAPSSIQHLDIDLNDPGWLLDGIDQPAGDQPAVAHVRQKRTLQGKLLVPEKCDPTGLLISGHSFGPGNHSDIAATRVGGDGSFELLMAPEHCYALAVCDSEWASEPLTGVFARDGSQDATANLMLKLYPATPLEIRATVGPGHFPLRNAYVQIARRVATEWKDADGNRRHGAHELRRWLKTDQDGYIRAGVARGESNVSISQEKWQTEQKLVVDSDKALTLSLHKPYDGRRQIAGQLTRESKPASGDPDVKVVALEHGRQGTSLTNVKVGADGRFELKTDCPKVTFFALDKSSGICGTAVALETESRATIALKPTATYAGKLVDAQGRPIADAPITLNVASAPAVFDARITTDASGRFRFEHVFVEVPLRLSAKVDGREELLARNYFEPAERREGIEIQSIANRDKLAPATLTLRERMDVATRDARLADMHVLVVIGDESRQSQDFIQRRVLDGAENPSVYEYLPLLLTTEALGAAANDLTLVKKAEWPMPKASQITLAAIDGQEKTLGTATILRESPDSGKELRAFLDRHKPALVDGQELWQATLAQAKESDKRVLLQFGGPRCGPCFRFSRWTEEHHEQLERDFVILKLHSGRHAGADKLELSLRGSNGGIPWTAILDGDGKVQVTSDGPLGNIGFPGEFESVRHFRRMLEQTAKHLSGKEIAALVATLGK